MKQFNTVFNFELMNYLKRKSYIIVTVVLVAIVAVVLCIPLLSGGGMESPAEAAETTVTKVLYLDETGADGVDYFNKAYAEQGTEFTEAQDMTEAQVEEAVENGAYDYAVIQTGPLAYKRIAQNITMYDMFDDTFAEVLKEKYMRDELGKLGVSETDLDKLDNLEVQAEVVTTETGADQMNNFFYTYVLIFALYMAIVIYGQFVASSVATEKSSRAMELLITSADPKSLIFGKVIGTGLAGLLQFVIILGSAFVVYNINAEAYADNPIVQSIFAMPVDILLYTALFFVLGFFIYAFMYAALGSLVSRMEDLGATTQPITLLFVAAFIVTVFSMSSGDMGNPAIIVCSFIPFTSPMAMFTRIAMGYVPPWEIVVSVAILLVSTIGIGFLATAIYRLGVLMYGKPPKPAEIVRMLKNSKAS